MSSDFEMDSPANLSAVNKARKHSLTVAVFQTFIPELSLAFMPRLAYIGFSLAQPYLVNATIRYIGLHSTLPLRYGYGLIGAYALCYVGIAVSVIGPAPLTLYYQNSYSHDITILSLFR
jgi:hypothetical protein